jgi:anti-sigma regulatory factor (Ser/Thr protein kinase)
MASTKTAPPREGDSLSLSLAPSAENVAVARHAVSDLAAQRGASRTLKKAAEMVVTEAFTNAARHAYSNGYGEPIEVIAAGGADRLEIAVRDRGQGFRPRPAPPDGTGRMGLPLMAAVADSVRLLNLPGGGTEVRAEVTPGSAGRALGDF